MSVYSTYLLPIILYVLYITTFTLPIYNLYDTVANRSTSPMYYTHTTIQHLCIPLIWMHRLLYIPHTAYPTPTQTHRGREDTLSTLTMGGGGPRTYITSPIQMEPSPLIADLKTPLCESDPRSAQKSPGQWILCRCAPWSSALG